MHNNGFSEDVAPLLILAAVVLGGVIYAGYIYWGYVMFFVLPFILGSVLVAWLFLVVTEPDGSSSTGARYRRLVVLYPVLILIVLVTFHWGSERVVERDEKGNIIAREFEWPELNKAAGGWEKPRKKMRWGKEPKEAQVFDRREMGWGFWFALFLGGPTLFLFWSKNPEEEDQKRFQDSLRRKLDTERESYHRREIEISNRARREEWELRERIREMWDHQSELKQEIRELKARTEYSGEEEVSGANRESGDGLLDQGIL